MAKDVLITPGEALIQFSSSQGTGSGQILADDSNNLVISNLVGDVLLGDGASDVFIGNGSDNVDIVFEQNGEIRDDGTGKTITIGSKTTTLILSSSSDLTLQGDGGNVGIGTAGATSQLHISGSDSNQKYLLIENTAGTDVLIVTSSGNFGKVGIGTPTPQNTLSVSGSMTVFTSNNTSRLTVGEADDSGVSTANSLVIETTGASNKSHTFTVGTGNDYIVEALGNKADVHLSAKGSIKFGINNGSAYNFTEKMMLTGSTGNLGIGTSTPGEKLEVIGNISASGFVSASSFIGNGAGLSNVSATVADESITLAKLAHAAANTVLVRDASSTGDPSFKAVTNTQILIGDGTGFTAAALSGDVTMTNGGVVTIAANSVEGTMLNTNSADTSTMELSSDSLSVLKVPNALTAGAGLNNGGGTFDGAAARTFSVDSASLAPFFSASMNDFTAAGDISASGALKGASLDVNGNADFGDGNITNVGTIDVDKIRADAATNVNIELVTSGIKFNAEAGDTFTFNDVYNNTDLQYYDANEDVIFTIDQSVPGVGIGTLGGAPAESLDVEGSIQSSGNVIVAGSVIHKGDTNTSIAFTVDAIAFNAGGVEMLKLTEAATNTIALGAAISTNITASGNISCSGNIIGELTGIDGDVTGVDSILNTGLKIGRDSTDLIDFATADNVIGFRVGNNDEMKLNTTSLQPATSNGLALGASNRQWSDLFLAEGGVINFDNGDVTLTQTGNNLTMAGGSLSASGDFGVSGTATITTNKFNKTSNTDADHQGDVVFFGGTTSMDAGKIYAYGNDGTWNLSDADHNNLSGSGLLGVALGAASDTNGMLLRGTVTLDHDPGAVGDVLYLSTTAGRATSTVPSGNTDIARVVGYCLDASNGQIWFNPDNTFVEVSA